MSVQLTTKTAIPAEPPKQSAPAQPWVATGLTSYHNQYVLRAADLGCCGVTHLMIFEDSSLPARVGKMAVFVIVSVGFAIYDVLYAVWEKISCSRDVVAVSTSPANNNALNTNPSSATSAENPAKPKNPKSNEVDPEETGDSTDLVDLTQLSTEFDLEDPQAVVDSITANHQLLKSAIEELRHEIAKRPPEQVLTGSIDQLGNELGHQNSVINGMLNTDYRSIEDLKRQVSVLTDHASQLTKQMNGVMRIAQTLNPELAAAIEGQSKPAPKGKKTSGKSETRSEPNDVSTSKKKVDAGKQGQKKQGSKGSQNLSVANNNLSYGSEEEVVSPPFGPSQSGSLSMQSSSQSSKQMYKQLQEETVRIGQKLRLPTNEMQNCRSLPNASYEKEIERLGMLKLQWTEQLLQEYTSILNEIDGIGQIRTAQILQRINETHPKYDQQLAYLEQVVERCLPEATKVLWEVLDEEATRLPQGFPFDRNRASEQINQSPNTVKHLQALKKAIGWLREKIADSKKPPATQADALVS